MTERTGHCRCGSIRFRLNQDPVATVVCWCRDCQYLASNGTVSAIVASSALEVVGTPKEFESTAASGNPTRQSFCGRCGSHLFGNSAGAPGFTAVRVGTLDDPSSVAPTSNIWSASAPAWACLNSALARVERQ